MNTFPDKFQLTREENIFVAKKYLKDSIYRSAQLEGMAVTFPQTEAILENATVSDVSAKDIAKVFGLRDAWQYLLSNLDAPLDLKFLQDLHQLIAREDVPWNRLGVLRTEGVRISGTNYLPPLPDAEKIHADLTTIISFPINPNNSNNPTSSNVSIGFNNPTSYTDRAITAMLYLMRTQPFLDGNKRIGTLVCNKILIANGCGIFSLPPELKQDFTTELVKFYETGEMVALKTLIYDHCLTGLASI